MIWNYEFVKTLCKLPLITEQIKKPCEKIIENTRLQPCKALASDEMTVRKRASRVYGIRQYGAQYTVLLIYT